MDGCPMRGFAPVSLLRLQFKEEKEMVLLYFDGQRHPSTHIIATDAV